MFAAPWFLVGGLIAVVALTVVHLMHRRRFRIVRWAAMDFLLQAARRSRRRGGEQHDDVAALAHGSACDRSCAGSGGLCAAAPFEPLRSPDDALLDAQIGRAHV